MSELTDDERAELEALRARVRELERERAEQIAAANAAVAAAQERVYWLDRWHLDLNALMAQARRRRVPRRGARRARGDPARSAWPSASCSDEPDVLRRRPRPRRGALPAGAARRRARAGPRRRAARRRLGLDATARWSSRARPAPSVLEIPRAEFGHGRTRNLAAERTSRRADLLPHAGRDAAAGLAGRLRGGVRARRRRRRGVRPAPAAAGHVGDDRARADRVLRRLRARRRARVLGADDPMFLSNVNACYRRDCWEQIRFDDVPLRRGPGVRARDGRARLAARLPARRGRAARARLLAGRLHARATSTSTAACARRAATSSASACARRSATCAGSSPPTGAGWASRAGRRAGARRPTGRSAVHHATRKLAAALGSHAHRLPDGVQRAISLEGRGDRRAQRPEADRPAAGAAGRPCTRPSPSSRARAPCRCSRRCRGWPTPSGCTSRS